MEADNIAGGKEPKRLPVWACIPLFIVILFILLGLYGTLARGCLSLVLGVEARHPGVMGYIILEASMLLAVLTAAIPMLRFIEARTKVQSRFNDSISLRRSYLILTS